MKKEFDVVVIGTLLIDSIIKNISEKPVSASGYTAESGILMPGGEALNESASLARFGMNASLLGFLGNDAGSDLLFHEIEKYHIDPSLLVREKTAATPVSTLLLSPDGTRKSITNQAHRHNFHPEKYMENFDTKAVSLASLFRAPFNDPAVLYDVVRKAKEKGAVIYADTKLPNFIKLGLSDIKDSLREIDYITPNEDEAKYYSGETDPEKAAGIFLDHGVKNVIIKLGDRGCLFQNAAESYCLPAHKVTPVDTTGAGDSFLAGFIAAKSKNYDNETALKIANAAGAMNVQGFGGTCGADSFEALLNFIK